MQSRAALARNRFGQKGQHHAMFQRHFAGHLAKQHGLIHRFDGAIIGQGEFELRRVIFGGDQFQPKAGGLGLRPDRIGKTAGVGRASLVLSERSLAAGRYLPRIRLR